MPYQGYGRKTSKNIDLSSIAGAIGGIPEENPNVGATGPGDVDPSYKGDPSAYLAKTGTGPYATPSFWQRLLNPQLSNEAISTNMQYGVTPAVEAQAYGIKKGQAADMIAHGYKYATGEDMPPEQLKDAVGAYGLKTIGGGLGSEEIGRQQKGSENIRLKGPATEARASVAGSSNLLRLDEERSRLKVPESQAQYELASATYGTKEASAKEGRVDLQNKVISEELKNELSRAMRVTPLQIEIAAKDAAAELQRQPTVAEIQDRVAVNKLNEVKNIEPLKQARERAVAEAEKEAIPLDVSTIHKAAVGRNVAAGQPPTESQPRLFDVNPAYKAGDRPSRAYTVQPGVNPAYVSPYDKSSIMMEKMGGGGGVPGITPLPGGAGFRPAGPSPSAPASRSIATPSAANIPTYSVTQPTEFADNPAWDKAPSMVENRLASDIEPQRQAYMKQLQDLVSANPNEYDYPGTAYGRTKRQLKWMMNNPSATTAPAGL